MKLPPAAHPRRPAPTPPPAPPPPQCSTAAPAIASFEQVNASSVSTIGDQQHMLRAVRGWKGAPELAAELCCNISSCVAFSADAQWGLELFSTTRIDVSGVPGGHWTTWVAKHASPPLPPPPPPPPSWGGGGCVPGGAFCQTLDIATSTVTVRTPSLTVNVSVDLTPPHTGSVTNTVPDKRGGILRVRAAGRGGLAVGLHVALEPYRKEQPAVFAGPYYQRNCYPRFEHADTIVERNTSASPAITFALGCRLRLLFVFGGSKNTHVQKNMLG